MIIDTPAPRSESTLLRFLRSGAVPTLALVLLVLVIVFGTLLGERIVGAGALQSMAFQLPELGILSLAMMVPLLSGGLNLSIIATANLCALTMAWVLTSHVPGAHGVMWGGWQVVGAVGGGGLAAVTSDTAAYLVLAGICTATLVTVAARLRDRPAAVPTPAA